MLCSERKMRGATAVEITVMLPLLMIILFGIIETSVLLFDRAMITNAAREGARFGILFNTDSDGAYSPMSDAEIQQIVDQYLADSLISFAAASAETTVVREGGSGTQLTVRVEYPYTFIVLPNLAPVIENTVSLVAEATMRME